MSYALLALLGVEGGVTSEASVECADLDEVCSRLREVVEGTETWQAVTLLHIEDLPAALEGARQAPGGLLG